MKSIRMNTEVLIRGGVTRSSVEGPVMGVERRRDLTELMDVTQLI